MSPNFFVIKSLAGLGPRLSDACMPLLKVMVSLLGCVHQSSECGHFFARCIMHHNLPLEGVRKLSFPELAGVLSEKLGKWWISWGNLFICGDVSPGEGRVPARGFG